MFGCAQETLQWRAEPHDGRIRKKAAGKPSRLHNHSDCYTDSE